MRNDTKLDLLWDEVEELKKSGGGGSDLPDVTKADNGMVLGVVNGAWNKMAAPSGVVNYSTNEQDTGTKWINGKNIYKKTFIFSEAKTLSSNSWVDTNFAVGDIETLISCEGYYHGNDNKGIALSFVSADNTETNIRLLSLRPAPGQIISGFTLTYTKATTTKSKRKTTK